MPSLKLIIVLFVLTKLIEYFTAKQRQNIAVAYSNGFIDASLHDEEEPPYSNY